MADGLLKVNEFWQGRNPKPYGFKARCPNCKIINEAVAVENSFNNKVIGTGECWSCSSPLILCFYKARKQIKGATMKGKWGWSMTKHADTAYDSAKKEAKLLMPYLMAEI